MSVYVWDIDEADNMKKVYKVKVVRVAENVRPEDNDETCWDVKFKTDDGGYYYPESRLFSTRKAAEEDMHIDKAKVRTHTHIHTHTHSNIHKQTHNHIHTTVGRSVMTKPEHSRHAY